MQKYKDILYGAQRRGIDFSLSLEYLNDLLDSQDGKCYYSGLPISAPTRRGATASLDRKDSSLPYIEGNVVWVHYQVNYMKHALSEERFLFLIKTIGENLSLNDQL